ncbi:MAG: 3'-5' exonuclease [Epsilonproteobacteria bacterium]|nr:3'-5' exonuclease [Campylobacterota bacterium]
MICIFDCETVPDVDLLKKIFGYEGSDREISQTALEEQEERSGSSFLPIPFHKVVAISAVICDDFGRFMKVSSIEADSEKGLIEKFLSFIDDKNPKLVSFNGRTFDIPMLMVRAMKYNISCPSYFEKENQLLNKNKWENYRTRYSDRFHVDLMDHIAEFGAVRGLKLDVLCSLIGAPGKYDVSGDQVLDLYYQKEFEKIREYCESDVLNTYWLYLQYEQLKGNLTLREYFENLSKMAENLPDRGYREVFRSCVEKKISEGK